MTASMIKAFISIILVGVVALSSSSIAATTTTSTTTTTTTEEPKEVVPILKDEREEPLRGNFKFHFETGDGIDRQEQGDSSGTRTGVIRFPLPNGETFELKFKAGPNGFEPESSYLPQAPVFPHPIPEHAKQQLERHSRLAQRTL